MKKNVGYTDKIIRLFLAAVIAILYFTNVINGAIALALGVVALILVVTSFINFCPLYAILGKSTCKI